MHYLMACNGQHRDDELFGCQTARKIAGSSNAPVNAFDGGISRPSLLAQLEWVLPSARTAPATGGIAPRRGGDVAELTEINDAPAKVLNLAEVRMTLRSDAGRPVSAALGGGLGAGNLADRRRVTTRFQVVEEILFAHITFGLLVLATLLGRLGWRVAILRRHDRDALRSMDERRGPRRHSTPCC
jgi:hypothetical protein